MNSNVYFSLWQVKLPAPPVFRASVQSLFRSKTETSEWSFYPIVEFHWHLSLTTYSAACFPQHIHQYLYFYPEKWWRERKINPCINSSPLLRVWKGILQNQMFTTPFCLLWNNFFFFLICSAKLLAKDKVSRKEKKKCKVRTELEEKKNCLNLWISEFFHQQGRKKINALHWNKVLAWCFLWSMSISEIHKEYLQISASSSDPLAIVNGVQFPSAK